MVMCLSLRSFLFCICLFSDDIRALGRAERSSKTQSYEGFGMIWQHWLSFTCRKSAANINCFTCIFKGHAIWAMPGIHCLA